jgi:DNA-binding transcriptional regulator LsrR (DeoR family)
LLLVASLYYREGLPQSRVAKLAGISQANVSRLLNEARQKGLVQITVAPFTPRDENLEKELRSKFNLNKCIVIKTFYEQTADQFKNTLGHFAGPIISKLIKPKTTVCVAAGRHINALTKEMKPVDSVFNTVFVQAIGDISPQIQENDAIEIARRLAKRWSGQYHRLQAPAITSDHESYKVFVAHEQIKAVLNYINNADIAIIGIGNPANSVFYGDEFSKPEKLADLKSQGVVGEICGHFIDEEGREFKTDFTDRIIGVNLAQLQKIPEVVAVTSGVDRAKAVRGSIRSGITTSLVIDNIGGNALLQLD